MVLFFGTLLLGPTLGPVVGSYVAAYKGWQWSQWCIPSLGTASWVFTCGAQETYGKAILRARMKRMGLPLPPSPIPTGFEEFKVLLTTTLTRPDLMLLTDPIVSLVSLYTAFNFSMLFSFLAAFPPTFQIVYGFPSGQSGLVLLGVAAGCVVGAGVLILIDKRVYQRRLANSPEGIPPEQRLWGSMLGSFLLPVSLFWFAWTARESVHWMVPIIAAALFGCASILFTLSCVLYLTDVYGAAYGASAMAANGLLRYGMGGSFPLFIPAMYDRLGSAWATSVLAFLSTASLPIPFVFYKMGPRIRKMSSYAG